MSGIEPHNARPTDTRQWERFFLRSYLLLALIHVAMLSHQAFRNSPTRNEPAHLVAGISHLRFQRFDLYRVNPPLVRMCASLPVSFTSFSMNWDNYVFAPNIRAEYELGQVFLNQNGKRAFDLVSVARLGCIPFSLLGGWVCALWAKRLYGAPSGIMAMLLWFFSPMILGHGSLITPDAGAAATGLLAMYCVSSWLAAPRWSTSLSAGFAVGAALLCKNTLLILYPVVFALWLVSVWMHRDRKRIQPRLGELLCVFGASVFIVNAGYMFEDTGKRLGDFRFQSSLFAEAPHLPGASHRNRFSDTFLAEIPIPFPANYVQGIDTQRRDFERGVGPSYLCGTWKSTGWWYWYVCAFVFKTPLGTLALFGMTLVISLSWRQWNANWYDELCLLLPAIAILSLVSSQTAFTIHYRYALPALPFLFVWSSKPAQLLLGSHPRVGFLPIALVLTTVIESAIVFPHSLSFFNSAVGGPRRGHCYLLDSNIGWGQDMMYFDCWRRRHANAGPWHLAYFGRTHPHLLDIEFMLPPTATESERCAESDADESVLGPRPGWFAIDVNHLHAARGPAADSDGGWTRIGDECHTLCYFRHFTPTAMAGYSIYVYHIALDEANQVRQELGMAPLQE